MTQIPEPGSYEFLDFNAPLSGGRADSIARSLAASNPASVLDIGCGWGELLLRTVAAAPLSVGWGVDSNTTLVDRGRANAATRGLAERVAFMAGTAARAGTTTKTGATTTNATAAGSATEAGSITGTSPTPALPERADVVICVGADHAFGDQRDALRALSTMINPGGRLLFGTGFWERPPSAEQAAAFGATPDELLDLAGLVDLAIAEGYRPLRIQTASRDEWEEFESGYLADYEEWLFRYGDQPEAADIRMKADQHRDGWLRGYRHVLGFAYLTLAVNRP